MANIGGVVVADVRCDVEVSAKESGSQFGNQFIDGIAFIALVFAAKLAIEAALVLGLVR